MSFAARARRLAEDAEIVVLERDPYVSYANCGLPYHLGGEIGDRDSLLLHTPRSLAESLALDVRTGHEVLAIDPAGRAVAVRERATGRDYHEAYDVLVLSTGDAPVIPPIPERRPVIGKLRAGQRQTLVIGVGHGMCTCEGAAFEYTFNVEHELRTRGLRDLADVIYLSNEYERHLPGRRVRGGGPELRIVRPVPDLWPRGQRGHAGRTAACAARRPGAEGTRPLAPAPLSRHRPWRRHQPLRRRGPMRRSLIQVSSVKITASPIV